MHHSLVITLAFAVPATFGAVTLRVANASALLKVESTERRAQLDELVTYAAGTVPAALIGAFAASGNLWLTRPRAKVWSL